MGGLLVTTLTGKQIANTYKDLLQIPNSNNGIDATIRLIEDGESTASPLGLSTNSVEIHGIQYPSTDGSNGQVLTTDGAGNLTFTTVSTDTFSTFSADTGSTTANSATDTLSVIGGTNITTFISGDVLTIDASTGSQNLYETFTGDTGSTTANSATDTLSITGGTNITTTVTTDTVTIDTSAISNLVEDTTPQLGGNLDLNANTLNQGSEVVLDLLSQTGSAYIRLFSGHTQSDGLEFTFLPKIQGYASSGYANLGLDATGGGQIYCETNIGYTNDNISSSATNTLQLNAHTVFTVLLDSNVTFSFSTGGTSFSSDFAYQWTVYIKQPDSGSTHTVTWPFTVAWPGGTAPTITPTNGAVDIITLMTFDGGTTFFGNYSQDYS